MSKPRVLVMSRAIADMTRLSSDDYDILVLDEAEDREALLRERGAGIRAILCAAMERLDAARLALLPDLKLIAVIAALPSGALGGAALDVFDHEPIEGSRYADVPGLVMAPHVAGATEDALAAIVAAAIGNIRRYFAGGTLLNRVA